MTANSCLPEVWRPNQDGHPLQGASNARWAVQEHGGANPAHARPRGLERLRAARTTHGRRTAERDRTDARDGAGSDAGHGLAPTFVSPSAK